MSLGDVKTLASAPGLSTQQMLTREERCLVGINSSTIRLSVGMEHYNDIYADIIQALHAATTSLKPAVVHLDHDITDLKNRLCEVPVSEKILADKSSRSNYPIASQADCQQHASLLTQRTSRLKYLYDQMTAITGEIETLQAHIRIDNEKFLSNPST